MIYLNFLPFTPPTYLCKRASPKQLTTVGLSWSANTCVFVFVRVRLCVYTGVHVCYVCVLYGDTHTTLIVNFVQVTLKYMSRVRGVSMRM